MDGSEGCCDSHGAGGRSRARPGSRGPGCTWRRHLLGMGTRMSRRLAATAMGQVVAAAPGLAAEALAHLAQALVGDGD